MTGSGDPRGQSPLPELRLYSLVPKPCKHDLRGRPHLHYREALRCLDRNGVPGFVVAEIALLRSK